VNISYRDFFSHSFTFEEIAFDEIINKNNLEIGKKEFLKNLLFGIL